jgi:hypothetical protein
MFGTAEVLNLIAALRTWESEGQKLPHDVLVHIEEMEETLRAFEEEHQFEADMAAGYVGSLS